MKHCHCVVLTKLIHSPYWLLHRFSTIKHAKPLMWSCSQGKCAKKAPILKCTTLVQKVVRSHVSALGVLDPCLDTREGFIRKATSVHGCSLSVIIS